MGLGPGWGIEDVKLRVCIWVSPSLLDARGREVVERVDLWLHHFISIAIVIFIRSVY